MFIVIWFCFLMTRRPTRSTLTDTIVPYTTRFRSKIARALDAATGMGKDGTRPVESGVTVRTVAVERLVQELAGDHQLFVMDPKGTPIHEQVFGDKPCFLLTDHIPNRKSTRLNSSH